MGFTALLITGHKLKLVPPLCYYRDRVKIWASFNMKLEGVPCFCGFKEKADKICVTFSHP